MRSDSTRGKPRDAFRLDIDKRSDVPLYAQIKDSIAAVIEAGTLADGARLPPVRTLALKLGVNLMTVARAYKDLTALGLVAGRGARGTFVKRSVPAPAPARAAPETPPGETFHRMMEAVDAPGVIAFTHAYPAAAAIDSAGFEAALKRVLSGDRAHVFAYSAPEGTPALRAAFAALLAESDIVADPSDIVVTTGGQQAVGVVARAVLSPGDTVLVERPTYFGALDVFRSLGVRLVGIDMEEDGPDLAQLERRAAETRPRLLFTMPTFHNPTGITASLAKRRELLRLCAARKIAVLEDDCCAELRFRGAALPALKALAGPDAPVWHVRSVGKAYLPGIRLGAVVAPHGRAQPAIAAKTLADLHTAPLLQEAFARFLDSGQAQASLARLCRFYAPIQDEILRRLQRDLPEGCSVSRPDGGFNLWLRLPEGRDARDLHLAALRRGVAVLAGAPLYPDRPDRATLRLSFGVESEEQAAEGADRLCRAIEDLLTDRPRAVPVLV